MTSHIRDVLPNAEVLATSASTSFNRWWKTENILEKEPRAQADEEKFYCGPPDRRLEDERWIGIRNREGCYINI
jgi:hypothetical protein